MPTASRSLCGVAIGFSNNVMAEIVREAEAEIAALRYRAAAHIML